MIRVGAIKLRTQVICGDELALAPGRAELLEAIDREGSISGAGRVMKISYRHAWLLVDEINRCWPDPVVETSAGGGSGGGTRLTAFGRELLETYRKLEQDLAGVVARSDLHRLSERLRDAPIAPKADSARKASTPPIARARKSLKTDPA